MNDTKSGWQTTEFWLTIWKSVLTMLTIGGIVGVADVSKLDTAVTAIIGAIVIFVTNAFVIAQYIKNRAQVKTAVISSEPNKFLRTER